MHVPGVDRLHLIIYGAPHVIAFTGSIDGIILGGCNPA